MALYWPQGWKKDYHQICNPWGQRFSIYSYPDVNVLSFIISNVGPNNKPKNAQSWPQVFSALTPSVKRALVYHTY
jgi:hypothetical protein